MKIRQANINDIDSLLELNRQVQSIHVEKFPEIFKDVSDEELRNWFKSQFEAKDTSIFVACADGKIIGYIILKLISRPANPFMHERKFAYIDQICVSEKSRRRGVGRKLIEHVINHARINGYNRVELDVWIDNAAARKSFGKLGFTTVCEKMVYG